jgi:DNA-binding CsgD family transcriptional regulator
MTSPARSVPGLGSFLLEPTNGRAIAPAMTTTPALDQLTDAQRECLRLVHTHHNSKEIAEIVGVSPSAVDKRIERAVQVLGVPSRFAAARMLAAAEGRATYERAPSEPFDLHEAADVAPTTAPDGPWWLVLRLFGLSPGSGSEGQIRNPLGRLQRLGAIVGLAFLIAMTSVALLSLGQTLSSLATASRSAPSR